MKTIELDMRCIQTVRALHIYLQYRLGLPAHYGRNLDALFDCLAELPGETCLVMRMPQAPHEEMAAFLPRLGRVLEDAQQANPGLHVRQAGA